MTSGMKAGNRQKGGRRRSHQLHQGGRVEAVHQATDGKGANIVIDFSGAPIDAKQCILMASKMGRVVFLGISHKGLDLSEKEVDTIMRSQLSVVGSWNSFTKPYPGEDWTESLKGFDEKGMTAKDIISTVCRFRRARCTRRNRQGRLLL